MPEPAARKSRPKPIHEQVMEEVQAALAPILLRYGEPAGFVVCVPWTVGQSDFPFGTVVVPGGNELSPAEVLDAIDQTRKMLGHLSASFGRYVSSGRKTLASLGREIHEQQQATGRPQGQEREARSDEDRTAGLGAG